jgi:DNA-binding GntR family transcriptional regulator
LQPKEEILVSADRASALRAGLTEGGSANGGKASAANAEPAQLTLQAAAQIRGLIIDRILLPGEKVRQVELAERIGVSRSPLREALRTLESDGLVVYEVNRGYVVARLGDRELAQIYRMRELLEEDLLRSVQPPSTAVLEQLAQLNDQMMAAIDARDVPGVLRFNRDFHFAIFNLSPLAQIRREVGRLWQMSDIYSAAWWRRQPQARKRISAEHKAIIGALRRFDLDKLVEVSAVHRTGGHERALSQTY